MTGKPGANEKYVGLRQEIALNEERKGTAEYKSNETIAKQFGCSLSYLYRVRYSMGLRGEVSKAYQHLPNFSERLHDATDDEGKLKDLLSEPLISSLDRLKVLSRLIRIGAPNVKITAIKAYEELTRTTEGRIGPGPPLTHNDKVTRLAKLLMAISVEVATEAWEIAYGFKPTTAPTRPTLQPESGDAPPAPSPVEEPLYDLPIPSVPPPSPRGRSRSPNRKSEGPPL